MKIFIDNTIFKQIKNEKGQSLVEFALIIPIVILILMGILEFGVMLNSYLTIANSSREAARLGSVGANDIEICARILELSPNLETSNISVDITPLDINRKHGESVTVNITYQYNIINPLIGAIVNNVVPLNVHTTMRVE